MHQRLEILAASGEVGLAVDLEEHADLPPGVDVGLDQTLPGRPGGLLGRRGHALLPQELLRAGDVSVRLDECFLALHHPDSGLLPELPDL